MKISSRIQAVVSILTTITDTTIPADKVLSHWNTHNRYAGSKDKSYIATMVYAILRNRMACVWWCEKYTISPSPLHIALVYIYFEHADIFETAFFDAHNPHALPPLDDTQRMFCELLGKAGDGDNPTLYVTDMPRPVQYNIPPWLYPHFESIYGDKTDKILHALNQPAPVDIRVNTLKSTPENIAKDLGKHAIPTHPLHGLQNGLRLQKRTPLSHLKSFQDGAFEVQDASSQRASKLVNARRGDKIVDFCAGAGGKSLAIAEYMENTGRIICCDVSEKRLQRAKVRLKRAGVNNTECRMLTSEADKWIKRRNHRHDGGFDKVIVDAPCTGTGTWRRNPDQKWRTTEDTLRALVDTQARILQSASRLVGGGGQLIYMTCSLLHQENTHQVRMFLDNNPHFCLADIREIWKNVYGDDAPTAEHTLQFDPCHHTYDGDGFYIAILERKFV